MHQRLSYVINMFLNVLLSWAAFNLVWFHYSWKYSPLNPLLMIRLECFIWWSFMGFSISLALRTGGSTGGTDFIAQFVSNKIHKGIWDYVFAFNCCMLVIFGAIFGWVHAGYSIVFQFLSTKAISSLYQRYNQVTIEFITSDPDPVIDAFMAVVRHGMSVFEGYGGYSQRKIYSCKGCSEQLWSSWCDRKCSKVDPKVIVNTYHTANFYGNFYQKPIE